METNNIILRRPKRKLCYTTKEESVPRQWADKITLRDVDKMFDDLDSSSHCDSQVSSSPQHQSSDTDRQHSDGEASLIPQHFMKSRQSQKGPEGNVLLPAKTSISQKLDTDFQMHGPVKTSSPIEENVVVDEVEDEIIERQIVFPIIFDCEDKQKAEATTESVAARKPRLSGDSLLNTPPCKVALGKPIVFSHNNKLDASISTECRAVTGKMQEKPQTSDGKRKTSKQENTEKPTPAVRQESEVASLEKQSTDLHGQAPSETPTRAGKDMLTFLQKLRDAGQPKPARKQLTPVKIPPLPAEPDDNFLILEDDVPLLFTIPNKASTSRRQKQGSSSSTDKDISTQMGTNDRPQENAQIEEEPVKQKMKRRKGRNKNEGTWPANEKDEFSPEDVLVDDLVEQEKPNKKKKLRKIPSEERNKAEEEAKNTACKEIDVENPSLKAEKKIQKESEPKRLKSSKENAKTSRSESLKGNRKVKQGSGDIKESVNDEAVKKPSQSQHNMKHADVDLDSLAEHQIMNLDTETKESAGEKAKHNKQQIMSEGSSSESGHIHGKRKRKPVGEWWLSCPQSTEETNVQDNRPTPKKSKQHSKDPSTPGSSPVKAKTRNTVSKKKKVKQPPLSSSQFTSKAKENKTKRIKNRIGRNGTQNKKTSTHEVLNTTEEEQAEDQQQEVSDQDQDPVQSSPLVLPKRYPSLNSGDLSFHRVYQPPTRLGTADSEKRKRKPPGNWWMANGMSEEVESTSLQPQQLKSKQPKSHEKRKKQSKPSRSSGLGIPKNGNMAALSKPKDIAPLKPKPVSTPKSVKRSLAMFKDIFTSRSDTPFVDTGGGVTASSAEVTVTDNVTETQTKTDEESPSMDAGNISNTWHSPTNHNAPQDSRLQSENTLKALRSGPSSMIVLEQCEKSGDIAVPPPPSIPSELCISDFCAPPLKPLILQPKDKANLTEWFKSLWSSTVDDGDITADQFDWYFYQGRAMGFLVDLNCGSICNGKILLGSHMKKPLWVDHSATTVFNLLTSSVSVIIDGTTSNFNAGQSFMVHCGQAYSLHNTTAQPAVLYFTRILAESSD